MPKDYKQLSKKEKKEVLLEVIKNANDDQKRLMPIKKVPKSIGIPGTRTLEETIETVKQIQSKSIEEEEWEHNFERAWIEYKEAGEQIPFLHVKAYIKSLLLSKEEEWKREQEILINTIIATLKK